MSLIKKAAPRNSVRRIDAKDGSLPESTQRVSVIAAGFTATITCLDLKRRSDWKPVAGLRNLHGFLGRNGISADKRESDGCTPAGLFRLGGAFGTKPQPKTKMPWRQITPDSWWVDDPESPWYNQWIEVPNHDGWASAEHLIDFPAEYAYAVVVLYNTDDIVPGKGSAIFLHCGDAPTSGCIAVKESDLLLILKWLDPEKHPDILIQSR